MNDLQEQVKLEMAPTDVNEHGIEVSKGISKHIQTFLNSDVFVLFFNRIVKCGEWRSDSRTMQSYISSIYKSISSLRSAMIRSYTHRSVSLSRKSWKAPLHASVKSRSTWCITTTVKIQSTFTQMDCYSILNTTLR